MKKPDPEVVTYEVEFRDEPPPSPLTFQAGRGEDFAYWAEMLRQNLGKWALYPGKTSTKKTAETTAYHINNGRRSTLPSDEFEAVTRQVKGQWQVWVRAKPKKGS